MTTKMSKQAEINYLRGRVNQLENQLAAARLLLEMSGISLASHKPCQCGHYQSDHTAQGSHACGQCDCEAFSLAQYAQGQSNA